MSKNNKRTFWQKWSAKYRFVILNSENFEERISFKISRFVVLIITSLIFLLLVGGTSSIIAFTPVREYIPGYTSSDIRRQVVSLNFLSDSLMLELEQNKRYLNNIKNIINGKPASENNKEETTKKEVREDVVFSKNTQDSLLRIQIESEEKFNVFGNPSQNDEQIHNMLFFRPIEGIVTQGFDLELNNGGLDIVAKENEVIKSTLDGIVMLSSWTSETGNVIAIMHKNNLVSIYKHNSVLLKKEGDKVNAGDHIAIIGNSGKWTSGPHLHFELWYQGIAINPQTYILF
jgi:murein DD-endopeptidase MepM/ murein hydrolase activator NlpD